MVLGRNFRSRAAVLDACNYLFAAVMGETVGGLAYTDREALHLGADYYPDADDPRYRTEVLLVDAAGLGEDDDAPDKTALEARLAAQRIRALLDEGFPCLLYTSRYIACLGRRAGWYPLRRVIPNDASNRRSGRPRSRLSLIHISPVGKKSMVC